MKKTIERKRVQPTTCRMMKSKKPIPALEDWYLCVNEKRGGIEIVYLVPNELVKNAERLGAVKVIGELERWSGPL